MLGAAISAFDPARLSLAKDFFPKEKLATINSVMMSSLYLGYGLCPLTIIGVSNFGWRSTTEIIGYIGIAAGVLGLIFIEEPMRQKSTIQSSNEPSHISLPNTIITSLSEVMKDDVTRYCTIAAMFRYFVMYSFDYYFPSYILQ
jgi:predicted MFS family arabinose efflux permease